MPITSISIQNYKSLRSVTIAPKPLSVIVGPNSAGKTNFADCLDFIGEVYREGLEVAVSKKGGYENIAFRRQQRSKLPIRIEIVIELTGKEIGRSIGMPNPERATVSQEIERIRLTHSYEFVARSSSIRSPFHITEETFSVSELQKNVWKPNWSITKNIQGYSIDMDEQIAVSEEEKKIAIRAERKPSTRLSWVERFRDASTFTRFFPLEDWKQFPKNELFMYFARYTPVTSVFLNAARSIGVYQVNPRHARGSGVPSSHPQLGRFGDNLPAVIDEMKKNRPSAWSNVLEVMHSILPDLLDISVDYTSTKQLGLFFRESGYRRAWTVEEVSDGTLQALALLVAIFDERASLLVLEELENSVHPWIIRLIVDTCIAASETKQIILTTHSPVVIDAVSPDNIWVVWREKGESHISQLTKLDTEAMHLWTEGKLSTFGLIDSGIVSEATPPSPSSSESLEGADRTQE